MQLEHYPQEKLKKEILDIIGKYLDLNCYRIFFFGSRVSGKSHERSDIDIGIEGKDPIPADAWLEIQEEIGNLSTLYKIELVNFTHVSSLFREVALQHTELLHP